MSQRKVPIHTKYFLFYVLYIPLFILAGCDSGGGGSVAPTPTLSLQFQQLKLGIPQQALAAPIIGPLPDSQMLHIGVSFKLDPNVLKKFDKQGTDSSQSSSDLAKSLGISDQTYQTFKSYFGIGGATVNLNQTRTWMTVDIKAGSLAPLLQTKFVQYKLNNRTFYTPDPAHMPQVPVQLGNQILAVSGLDNYSVPLRPGAFSSLRPSLQPMQSRSTGGAQVNCYAMDNPSAWNPPNVLSPSYLAQAYGVMPLWQKGWYGQGQKVLIVEPQSRYVQDDLNAFFTCDHFQGSFNTITVDGLPSYPETNESEATLDIEMVAAMAPRAQIVDYQGDSYGAYKQGGDWLTVVNDLLQRIVDDYRNNTLSGTVISISLQSGEPDIPQSDMLAIDQSLQILTQVEHMTVFISSGDCAAFETEVFGQVSVSFPASDPWVVGVGGSVLSVDTAGNRTSEVAWANTQTAHSSCNNSWGSGGGVSRFWQKPDYQQQTASQIPGLNNQYSTGYRQSPDLAASAEYDMVYMNGQWGAGGGTSAAAPIVAGGMAVMVGALRYAHHGHFFYGPGAFYNAQANFAQDHPFYGVTQGANYTYAATSGWNYLTGLGAPNFFNYYQCLQQMLPSNMR